MAAVKALKVEVKIMAGELKNGKAVAACTGKKEAQCMTKSPGDVWCFDLELSLATSIGTLLDLFLPSKIADSCGAKEVHGSRLGIKRWANC